MTEIQEKRHEFRNLGPCVPRQFEGHRVDAYLGSEYPFLTRAQWSKRIQESQVEVNGKGVRPSYRLREGDVVRFYQPVHAEPPVDKNIFPLWKQGQLMAVYKPAHLPMHESGPYRTHTFSHLVKTFYGENWSAVHRLDRETSGIVLVSSDRDLRQKLAQMFLKGEIKKTYLAIVKGKAARDKWVERGPIGDLEDSIIRIKKWVVPHGLPSETHFELLEKKDHHSLLRAYPMTGRTNQIRIHCAFNDLPIVGDKLYHPNEQVFDHFFRTKGKDPWVTQQVGFSRLLLHAESIGFTHPETLEDILIRSEMTDEMRGFWESC